MNSKVTITANTTKNAARVFGDLEVGDWFLNYEGELRQRICRNNKDTAVDPEDGLTLCYSDDDEIRYRVNVHITYEVAE